ncbi:MAG: (2Fe-2S)-binding protein [Oligoflexales bacterium]
MADEEKTITSEIESDDADKKLERAKQLNRVICICKGIKLGQIMDALKTSETVAEVNNKAGTGQGGCQGERCGPRIKQLLRKIREVKESKK